MNSMLLLLGARAMAQQRGEGEPMQLNAKGYSQCRTPRDRLVFCISAIDAAVIDIETDINEVGTLFGEDFIDLGPDGVDGKTRTATVLFEKPPKASETPPPGKEVASELLHGWYLQIKYDDRRRIRDYWLSDTQKGVPKRSQH
jgi:hypothetical protein